MMQRKQILFTVLFLLLFVGTGFTFGQDEEAETSRFQGLLQIADDQIFMRSVYSQDFSDSQGYVNEFPNPTTIHQYYIYDGQGSDVLMTMIPSEEMIRTTNVRMKFENYLSSDFHVKYTVERKESVPLSGGGFCWVRYSNVLAAGEGRESGVIIYPGEKIYIFTPVDGKMTYEEIGDLSAVNPDEPAVLDILRTDGCTYIYVNGNFYTNFKDGITDKVSFESGAELSQGGNRIHCGFDDFSMRIK